MIDIENELYTLVKNALPNGTNMSGDLNSIPTTYPAVTMVEMDNSAYRRSMDSSFSEKFVQVMYEINVYTQSSAKKTEAKTLMATIDSVFLEKGFIRTFLNPIPNPNEPTIYRLTARYEAVVDSNKTIYRK